MVQEAEPTFGDPHSEMPLPTPAASGKRGAVRGARGGGRGGPYPLNLAEDPVAAVDLRSGWRAIRARGHVVSAAPCALEGIDGGRLRSACPSIHSLHFWSLFFHAFT